MNKHKQNIEPVNENYQRHGITEWYYDSGKAFKSNWVNGRSVGYTEYSNDSKTFFLI